MGIFKNKIFNAQMSKTQRMLNQTSERRKVPTSGTVPTAGMNFGFASLHPDGSKEMTMRTTNNWQDSIFGTESIEEGVSS